MLRDIWLSTVGVLSITVMSLCLVSTPSLTGKARAEVIRLTFNQFNPPGTTVARVFEDWAKWVEEKSGAEWTSSSTTAGHY
jgi:TRAP-type C4-dicarboxylate transport system substrate-binding protein